MKPKSIASLSLDLDNQWSYMKTHGDRGWESFPSYLSVFVPRALDFLRERDLHITFFIVGQDAALDKNSESLRALAEAGHEIGNHSFHHEPWLHLYTDTQIADELARAEEQIERVTGHCPRGFRGPGFSVSEAVLQTLRRRGYVYDASIFPTYLGPLARAYYFMTAELTPEERESRRLLFGRFSEGFRPLKPWKWNLDGGEMLEIPVTTLPFLKVPIHLSYILYLSGYSPALARTYFRNALRLCRMTGVQPSILLHPLDFLGGDDVAELSFFPGMQLSGARKLALLDELMGELSASFQVVTMMRHAEIIRGSDELRFTQATDLQYGGAGAAR
ncbi:MAG: polysaccharide deacetylase family protein [Blastocatellia bacterium]